MKRLFSILIVTLLLAVIVVPAFAAGGPPAGRGNPGNGSGGGSGAGPGGGSTRASFALAGTATAVDATSGSVTVTVACGNTLVKPYIGKSIVVTTGIATRILQRNPDGTATAITLGELAALQKVSISGSLADGVWTASRITVGASLTCLP